MNKMMRKETKEGGGMKFDIVPCNTPVMHKFEGHDKEVLCVCVRVHVSVYASQYYYN